MEILTYDELDDVQLSELTLACFNHTYSREHVENMVSSDIRMPEWGGELYACEGDRILGTVGLLYTDIKTDDGIIKAGGIRNVCTRPSASRRGISHMLMDEAHRRMKEEGVKFSLLMTSAALVAYALYRQLGYEDVHTFPTAFKKISSRDTEIEFIKPPDPELVLRFYRKSVEGLNGLVVRNDDFWKMAEARGWPENEHVRLASEDGETVGYAMYNKRRKQIDCSEIAAKDEDTLRKMIRSLGSLSNCEHVVFYYVNPVYEPVLRELGYTVNRDNWGRMMVKELDGTEFTVEEHFHVGIYESY